MPLGQSCGEILSLLGALGAELAGEELPAVGHSAQEVVEGFPQGLLAVAAAVPPVLGFFQWRATQVTLNGSHLVGWLL